MWQLPVGTEQRVEICKLFFVRQLTEEQKTVDQAVKKFKLEPLNVYTAKAKAKELNVEEVLYMNVQKNKYAYIVKDGARGYVLYQDEKSIYSKMYKGLKMTPLEP